jgi:hypothetical protein
MPDHFRGREAVVATMHGKESVITPVLLEKCGLICKAISDFNTDQYGTFTGQIARKENALTICKQKCLDAMHHSGLNIGIASEGSFFPHPEVPFLTINEEWLVIIDQNNNWEISESYVSSENNLNGKYVSNEDELLEFARQSHFPAHGLILRKGQYDYTDELKGIHNEQELVTHFRMLNSQYQGAYAETDMRAMHNPTRMKNIAQAALLLSEKMNSCCPRCDAPGFGVTEAVRGLPCAQCGSPTRSVLAHIYSCSSCLYKEERKYPKGMFTENPMYCDWCNP